MSIVAVLSLKGGVGKTMTAMHLAAVVAQDGAQAVVLDADEERSAARWAQHAGALPFEVIPAERDRLAQQCREHERKGAVVLIDTPPNSREILSRAGMVATTAIVPVMPTGLDVDRMMPTLALLRDVEASRGSLDAAILLTRWDGRKRLAREAEAALEGYPVLGTRIRALVRYEESFGALPSYLDEYTAAWEEVKP